MIHALEEAYKNQVMIGKFPFAILNLEINPEMVDINVHPTKLEVKFSNEKDIYSAVYYAVKNALYEIPNVPKIERTEKSVFKPDNKKEQLNLADLSERLKKNYSGSGFDRSRETYIPRNMTKRPDTPLYNASKNPFIKSENDTLNGSIYEKSFNKTYDRLLEDDISNVKLSDYTSDSGPVLSKENYETRVQSDIVQNNTLDRKKDEKEEVNVFVDEYFEIIGQIFDTYIIAEKGDEMMIIDQHAAHERLKYEELKREIEAKQPNSQILIEPVVMSLTGAEMSAFSENRETFNEMGFECEEFGEESIIVRAVPGGIEIGEVEPVMSELICQAENLKKELISDKKQCIMYSIACKSAVKANMRLSMDEMKSLVRSVLRLENINTCPHGRPIIITMSKKELEKEFKRIV